MKSYNEQLTALRASGNLRHLPEVEHQGIWILKEGKRMLNLSSNDYLGLASRQDLQEEFQASTQDRFYPYSSSSSRLLTGNFSVYTKLEKQIARSFDREAALIFNSGYHANTGIQHGRGCSGFKPPDSYQKAISQYPIVRRRGSCHRSPWKDGARYRRGTKLYPRDRSIGRYFRQGVSVYGGLFGLFPYDTGISGQYDATAHIQYGPATVPNRMDFLHLGATPLVHEGTGESSSI